jgi:hypothetical protein
MVKSFKECDEQESTQNPWRSNLAGNIILI